MANNNSPPPLGDKRLDRSRRLLEDPLPPKGRVKLAVANYRIAEDHLSKTPQAVVKITSRLSGVDHTRTHHHYISRNGQVALEDENGDSIIGREEIQELVDEWRVDFARKRNIEADSFKITIKNNDPKKLDDLLRRVHQYIKQYLGTLNVRIDKGRYEKNCNHVYITVKQTAKDQPLPALEDVQERFQSLLAGFDVSVKNTKKYKNRDVVNIMFSSPKLSSPEKVRAAVRNTAKQLFGDHGYRYVMALHTDTDNPHVHISVKMFNETTGKKLVLDPKDLHHMRQLYVEKSKEQGIKLAASYNYQRGKRKENKSIKEVKLSEKEQKVVRKLVKTEKQIASIKHQLKEQKLSPLNQAVFNYKQRFNTKQQYVDEAARLKQRSFNEVDPSKKRSLITLYKVLEKEANRVALDKVSQLNEKVRSHYLDDAVVLERVSAHAGSEQERHLFSEMARSLRHYAQVMPKAMSKQDQLVNEIDTKLTKQKQSDKDMGKGQSLERE